MAKKRKASATEIENDPSLKWFEYRQWEALWSDTHNDYRRFVCYTPSGKIKLAEMDSIADIPGEFDPLTLRRATARWKSEDFDKKRDESEGRFRPIIRGI